MRYTTSIIHEHTSKIYEVIIECSVTYSTNVVDVIKSVTTLKPHNYFVTTRHLYSINEAFDDYKYSIVCWNEYDFNQISSAIHRLFIDHLENESHFHNEKYDYIGAEIDAHDEYIMNKR